MEEVTYRLHLWAGIIAGIENTHDGKVDYGSEETATEAADSMNAKPTTRHFLEPYPCVFCKGWHIGRVYEVIY